VQAVLAHQIRNQVKNQFLRRENMAKAKSQSQSSGRGLGVGLIIGIVAIVIVIVAVLAIIGMYNTLVKSELAVDNAWGQVEVQYQRRADLIPNLVSTVKGYKDFEQATIVQVPQARSAWTGASTPDQKVAAAGGIDSALGRLMVVMENYPDLKANQNFLALQDELTNTENKVAVERKRYNDAVTLLNGKVRMFPTNFVAALFGIGQRTLFKAAEGAQNAPEVKF
jgi:LemA protein